MPDSGGYASQPVRANSPTNSDIITSPAPKVVIQKLKLFRNGKGDVARADLQRHDEVHEPRDQRHGHEEDHDHAVGGEDLVVVMRRQIAQGAAEGDRLLQSHHQGVGEATQQHDEAEHDVHDADLLVIDAGEPVAPQQAPQAEVGDRAQERSAAERYGDKSPQQDGLVERDRVPGQRPSLPESGQIVIGQSPALSRCRTVRARIASYKPGRDDRSSGAPDHAHWAARAADSPRRSSA